MERNLSFGNALKALKQGAIISREGWNGKGMFLFLRPEAEVPVQLVKTLPEAVRAYYDRVGIFQAKFTGYICMKAADDSIVNGWLASQTDMLAEDWCILE